MDRPLKLPDNRTALAAVVLLSLALKLSLLAAGKTINTDGILYITAAKYFDAGDYQKGWALFRMPAYPYLLYLAHGLIPDWIAAARFISIAAYTAAILPLYGLTRSLFNSQAAIWAAVLFALSPHVNIKSIDIIRDPVFTLCLAIYLWCFVEALGKRSGLLVLAAFMSAATALLFRLEAMVLLLTPVVFLSVQWVRTRDRVERKWVQKSILLWLLGIALMVLTVVFVFTFARQGDLIRSDEIRFHLQALASFSAFDNYQAIYAQLKELQQSPPLSTSSKSIAALTRHWMPLIYLFGQLLLFIKVLFPVYLLPLLMALKLFFAKQIKGNTAFNFVFLLFGLYFLLIYYSYITRDFLPSRLLYPLVFMLFGFMGKGMEAGLQLGIIRSFPKFATVGIVVLFLVAPVTRAVDKTLRSDVAVQAVGRWLQTDFSAKNHKIITSEPKVLYYADSIGDYPRDKTTCDQLKNWQANGELHAIERHALEREANAIVLLFKEQSTAIESIFEQYRPIKSFAGRKGRYVIFSPTGNS